MIVTLNGMIIGVVDKSEYSARELENAGFIVRSLENE